MPSYMYIGANNIAHKVDSLYMGNSDTHKKINKIYIGANNIAHIAYQRITNTTIYTRTGTYYTSSVDVGNMSSTTALTRASTSDISYETRVSTSDTSYETRASTSDTSYQTRASTSDTKYGTRASTSGTNYGTRASTSATSYETQFVSARYSYTVETRGNNSSYRTALWATDVLPSYPAQSSENYASFNIIFSNSYTRNINASIFSTKTDYPTGGFIPGVITTYRLEGYGTVQGYKGLYRTTYSADYGPYLQFFSAFSQDVYGSSFRISDAENNYYTMSETMMTEDYKSSFYYTRNSIDYENYISYTTYYSLHFQTDHTETTNTVYLTRSSTSGTTYLTRASTSDTTYLTRASTSNTIYLTRTSTSNTIYLTRTSTSNTIYFTRTSTSGYTGVSSYTYTTDIIIYTNTSTYYTSSIDIGEMSSTTALTRSSTSNTSYETRVSTSEVGYLTRVSTSDTKYGTRASTSDTLYGTRSSTSGTNYGTRASTSGTNYETNTVSKAGVWSAVYYGTGTENNINSSMTTSATMHVTSYNSRTYIYRESISGYMYTVYGSFTSSRSYYTNNWQNESTSFSGTRFYISSVDTKNITFSSKDPDPGKYWAHTLTNRATTADQYTSQNLTITMTGYYWDSAGQNQTVYYHSGLLTQLLDFNTVSTQTINTIYLTRVSTSGTTYLTRTSTSGTTYLTRASTSDTTYLTRASTSSTTYGTRVSTSSTIYMTCSSTSGYTGVSSSTYTTDHTTYIATSTYYTSMINSAGLSSTTALTKISTSDTSYGTRASTSEVGYLTRVSTSDTLYGTRSSTSGTNYGTRASTSGTNYETISCNSYFINNSENYYAMSGGGYYKNSRRIIKNFTLESWKNSSLKTYNNDTRFSYTLSESSISLNSLSSSYYSISYNSTNSYSSSTDDSLSYTTTNRSLLISTLIYFYDNITSSYYTDTQCSIQYSVTNSLISSNDTYYEARYTQSGSSTYKSDDGSKGYYTYSSSYLVITNGNNTKTTNTVYLTRSSTSGTTYLTRASTSDTTYLTRASTSSTTYGTRASTSGTTYLTRSSTSGYSGVSSSTYVTIS